MTIHIYTIEKTLYVGEISELIAETISGQITILPQHMPLITTLVASDLKIRDQSGKEQSFPITSGFLEVQAHNSIVVLAEV